MSGVGPSGPKYRRLLSGRRGRGGLSRLVTHTARQLAPVAASVAAGLGSSGFLSGFARANPPFASSAVHNALNMARIGTRVRLKRRRRTRIHRKGWNYRIKRRRFSRRNCP